MFLDPPYEAMPFATLSAAINTNHFALFSIML